MTGAVVVVTGFSASSSTTFFGAVEEVFLDALNASNLALPRFAAALVIDTEKKILYPSSRGRLDVRPTVVTASTSEDSFELKK